MGSSSSSELGTARPQLVIFIPSEYDLKIAGMHGAKIGTFRGRFYGSIKGQKLAVFDVFFVSEFSVVYSTMLG